MKMKKYKEFVNELKSSTYYSAADKLKNSAPNLSDRFKEHGEKTLEKENEISFKEKMEILYEKDVDTWLYFATKEDILLKRDENKIHPFLLQLEKDGYLVQDNILWNGAGMDKNSMFVDSPNIHDVDIIPTGISTINFGVSLDVFDYIDIKDQFDGSDGTCNFDMLDSIGLSDDILKKHKNHPNFIYGFTVKKLPRHLAKKLFNSTFLEKVKEQTWHMFMDENINK